jgi:hypothetical protein
MKHRPRSARIVLFILSAAVAASSPGLAAAASAGGALAGLTRAHEAYVDGNVKAMTSALKAALSAPDADALVRRNALQLLGKAYEAGRGQVDADWQLPAGIDKLKFEQVRRDNPDGVDYKFTLKAEMPRDGLIAGGRLVRFPDHVVLDPRAGIGHAELDAKGDGRVTYHMEDGEKRTPLPAGLYLMHFDFTDGAAWDAWFVLDDDASTASPSVRSPDVGQSTASANPEIAWDDFRSPQHQAYERRTLAVGVASVQPDGSDWHDRWMLWLSDPTQTSTVVGRDPLGEGDSKLEDGMYWLTVTYYEEHRFGDLRIFRGSRTGRHFYVRSH